MGKFLVKNAANGFKFGLIVANDEIILNSEIYSSEAACLAGIESVKMPSSPRLKTRQLRDTKYYRIRNMRFSKIKRICCAFI